MTNRQGLSPREWDHDMLSKLDGGLRRLMRMEDQDILKAVDREEQRLADKRREIDECLRIRDTMTDEDRAAVRRLRRAQLRELAMRPEIAAVIIDKLKPVPIRVRAVVQFTGNREDLLALGLEVNAHAHDIFTVTGTIKQLADLAAQAATLRMRLPLPQERTVEHAAQQAEIDQVHVPRPANPAGYNGSNVIVGVIDWPLDVTHHGFRDPGGAHGTRVRYMWVQRPSVLDVFGSPVNVPTPAGQQTPQQFHLANPGTTPNFTGLNYGIIYTDADIDTALGLATPYGQGANQICCEPELEEHGTHVAGIAAGSGHENNWATPPTHVGAAPEAMIVHVSNRSWNDIRIMDALAFIFAVADFEGVPVAVNISLGGNWGPHKGTTDQDRFIDNRLNSFDERVVVGTTGNDNRANDSGNGFRRGTVTAGNTESFTLTSTSAGGRDVWLEIWYTGPELEYQLTIGGIASGMQGAGADYTGTLSGYNVDVDRLWDADANMRGLRVFVDTARTANPTTIELRNPPGGGNVVYYAWVCSQAWLGNLGGATQNELTLNGNACCRSILAVGACDKELPPSPAAGEDVTDYSGAGPTVDGRIKPEIVAVGGTPAQEIQSANSNQASGYVGMRGTSMAAPLVTGAVALLFEEARQPGLAYTLNHDTVKALLINHANRLNLDLDPAVPGYDPIERNRYGYGRLRMIGPIDHLRPPVSVDLWVRTADDDYGEEPYLGGCFCGAPDIRVFEAGTTNETTRLTWGNTYEVRVTVRNMGDDDAVGSTVRLKYTLPWAAPNDWTPAEDASDQPLQDTVTVPALDEVEVIFQWRPESGEISGAPAGATHFCLLAEVDHPSDRLVFAAPTTATGSAWATNIKGTNNVALRNLHIQ